MKNRLHVTIEYYVDDERTPREYAKEEIEPNVRGSAWIPKDAVFTVDDYPFSGSQ